MLGLLYVVTLCVKMRYIILSIKRLLIDYWGVEPRAWRARDREPITGVSGVQGLWQSPTPWSWKPFSFWVRKGSNKFASFFAVCKFFKPQEFVIYLSRKTERVVHDGMDNVVYDKKCIKSVKFSYSLTAVTKETQSHRVRKTLTGPTPLLPRPL